jgi:hypothetical protein
MKSSRFIQDRLIAKEPRAAHSSQLWAERSNPVVIGKLGGGVDLPFFVGNFVGNFVEMKGVPEVGDPLD